MSELFYAMGLDQTQSLCVVCPLSNIDALAVFRGESSPQETMAFKWVMGRKPKDVIETTCAYPFIVSHKVIDVLTINSITGWKTFPVAVFNKTDELLPGYEGISVVGRCGQIDDSKRRFEWRLSPYNPDYKYKVGIGLHFDVASWDGSDIFTPQSGLTIVTETVKKVLTQEKIKGFVFVNINDFTEDIPTDSL